MVNETACGSAARAVPNRSADESKPQMIRMDSSPRAVEDGFMAAFYWRAQATAHRRIIGLFERMARQEQEAGPGRHDGSRPVTTTERKETRGTPPLAPPHEGEGDGCGPGEGAS